MDMYKCWFSIEIKDDKLVISYNDSHKPNHYDAQKTSNDITEISLLESDDEKRKYFFEDLQCGILNQIGNILYSKSLELIGQHVAAKSDGTIE